MSLLQAQIVSSEYVFPVTVYKETFSINIYASYIWSHCQLINLVKFFKKHKPPKAKTLPPPNASKDVIHTNSLSLLVEMQILPLWKKFDGFLPMHAKSLQSCPTLCNPMDYSQPIRLLCPWDSPGKNTEAGCYVLL